MLDPYSLVGKDLDSLVGNGYIRLVQRRPKLFGHIYRLGDWYRRLPVASPVYEVNRLMCRAMLRYLEEHHFDVILMSHIYPGEILTNLKNKGFYVPKTIFIATDYTCIPFTEEIDCDYYVTPTPEINEEFAKWGIPAERLLPMGIPVRKEFYTQLSRSEAKDTLGLKPEKHYLLLSGEVSEPAELRNQCESYAGLWKLIRITVCLSSAEIIKNCFQGLPKAVVTMNGLKYFPVPTGWRFT